MTSQTSDAAWIVKLILASLAMAISIKTLGPRYPLPPTLPVILGLLFLPSLFVLVILGIRRVLSSRSDPQS